MSSYDYTQIVFVTIPDLHMVLLNLCLSSKLDPNIDLKTVSAKEKFSSYKAGEDITCFVSKVRYGLVVADC